MRFLGDRDRDRDFVCLRRRCGERLLILGEREREGGGLRLR